MDRKAQNLALTKLLTEWPSLFADKATWGKVLACVIGLLAAGDNGEDEDGEEEAPVEYTGTYVQLANASKAEHDYVPDVKDAGAVLAKQLGAMAASAPGQLGAAIQQHVDATSQQHLQALLGANGVALA